MEHLFHCLSDSGKKEPLARERGMVDLIKRWVVAAMASAAIVFVTAGSSLAEERSLAAKSTASIAAEIEGLAAPDAKFVLASVDVSGGMIDRVLKSAPVGDQGATQIVQRSFGCSTGCSTGCSVGCSVGCSMGCR